LVFAKTDRYTWNKQYAAYSQDYRDAFFTQADEDGRRFQAAPITAPGKRAGTSGMPWRHADPTKSGRHWAIPGYVRHLLADPNVEDVQAALDHLGRLVGFSGRRRGCAIQQYEDDLPGVTPEPLAGHQSISSQSSELLGYSTQNLKP
jgi:hypothetical protein